MGDWVYLANDGDRFEISCPEDWKEMSVLLLTGKPINEPVCANLFSRGAVAWRCARLTCPVVSDARLQAFPAVSARCALHDGSSACGHT